MQERRHRLCGAAGPKGDIGATGSDGTKIFSGQGMPSGTLGANGDFYVDLTSSNMYGPKTDLGWGNPFLLKGTTGANGSAGSQILGGTPAPPAGTGVAGDYFMSTDTYLFYGPKTEAGWGLPVNLKGSKGDKEDPGNAQAFSTEWITFSAWAGIPSDFLIAEYHPAPAILCAIGAGSIKDFMDRNGIILAYLSNYLLLMSQYQFPGDFQMFPPVSQ